MRRDSFGSKPGSDAPAGVSVADELLAGVCGGLRQTDAEESVSIFFQTAGGEENRFPDKENTREAE